MHAMIHAMRVASKTNACNAMQWHEWMNE